MNKKDKTIKQKGVKMKPKENAIKEPETQNDTDINNLLNELHTKLYLKYPSQHYNHIRIWASYWNMFKTIK